MEIRKQRERLTHRLVCNPKTISSSTVAFAMSNEILFYDASIQSPTRPNKCYAPNTLYEYSETTGTCN